MGVISENVDPSDIKSSGKERKCGTCRHFIVKPPEVELAKYALPIEACAPGVNCLGGAVRGLCGKLNVMTESTKMVPNVPCEGKFYQPGGPSIRGQENLGSLNRSEWNTRGEGQPWLVFALLTGVMAVDAIRKTVKK